MGNLLGAVEIFGSAIAALALTVAVLAWRTRPQAAKDAARDPLARGESALCYQTTA